ncbi:YeeE/YedE family protein [Methylobrevis sp. L22]|uniref:YeeE/YedE family protein n=1 Tax=Methylobrevis albus TaxID=2793297 RepID=A0A931MXE4_9HYPH|nr:YeeE/YedE family protein [Methylobrevis albus]
MAGGAEAPPVSSLSPLRLVAAAAVLAATFAAPAFFAEPTGEGRAIGFSVLLGAVFGIVLQRSRFCFLCHWRDFQDRRDPRGVLAILTALAVGLLVYQVVISAWVPVVRPGALPPNAHIGPVSPALALAAAVFGIGMALSGSCLSAHLYRIGEGSLASPFALLGALAGFGLGFATWNPLYLALISEGRVLWLPHLVGYGGALVGALVVLAILAAVVIKLGRSPAGRAAAPLSLGSVARQALLERWPAALGGAAVGVLSGLYFLRVAPLGVTAELGSLARTAGAGAGLLPETLHGLDALRGCATVVKTALLSPNGAFVAALVAGSFAAALAAGQFRPRRPSGAEIVRALGGGVLMGWGAMIGLGCTVGVLLSGIHAGAVSGWVFLVFVTAGAAATLALRRRFGF